MRNALIALVVLVGSYFMATKLGLIEGLDVDVPSFGRAVRHR